MRFAALFATFASIVLADPTLPARMAFQQGATNVVIVGNDTTIYGLPAETSKVRRVLLTHARRDAISRIEAIPALGLDVIVPAAERDLFEKPDRFWAALATERFHDYAQRSTKIPVQPIAVKRAVSDGGTLN